MTAHPAIANPAQRTPGDLSIRTVPPELGCLVGDGMANETGGDRAAQMGQD